MNDEEADAFMREHEWTKWADCRSMVQDAYYHGWAGRQDEVDSLMDRLNLLEVDLFLAQNSS